MKRAAWMAAAAATLAGCGYVGAPLPPALEIPVRVTDLRAAEIGDAIEITFTVPAVTTDGMKLDRVRSVELRAAIPGETPATFPVPATAPGLVDHTVPARAFIGKDVVLSIRVVGPKGKPSDWSNDVPLHIDTPLERPTELKAENVEPGVRLTWKGSAGRYRIFRAIADAQPNLLKESDAPEFVDDTTQYGMSYRYLVQAISGMTQGSEVSAPASITPKDVFPPAIPAGVTAVPDVMSIELGWTRNTEPDFQGYNVYRSVEGAPQTKIASLIPAPTYSDRQIKTGKKYRYTVTAVDTAGNESQPSPPQDVMSQ